VDPACTPDPRPFHSECPRILHVGTKRNKNLDRAVEALCGLPCTLDVVGSLDDRQLALLSGSGVSWENGMDLSWEEMRDRYRSCDMLLFPSTFEGFGLPILEAQAMGRPVVTSRASSMPEVAGDGACLVDPFNVASIREGVLRVIRDREYREVLVRKGFENVERFRPEAVARMYMDVYEEVNKRMERG
jgi:glycosyltransferase involved in cell wall biosynthesis